jgi:hypothetical protein
LFRTVGFDVAEELARLRNPAGAARLSADLKRNLGVGNSSGIGMVAALVRWPVWLSAYNFPRELALAFVLGQSGPVASHRADKVRELLQRASRYYFEQPDCPVAEIERPETIAMGLQHVALKVEDLFRSRATDGFPWLSLSEIAGATGSHEIREQVHAIMIDAFPEFGDACAELFLEGMKVTRSIDPEMRIGDLLAIIHRRYGWVSRIDYGSPDARTYFWYRSEEFGENRRGELGTDAGDDNPTYVDVAGAIRTLQNHLSALPPNTRIGYFLLKAPRFAHVVSRVQLAAQIPYSEIRGNIIDRNFLPMDGIRFLLSTMGLECSHPHNTRWVKGVFLQGAPTPEEIRQGQGSDWIFPQLRAAHVAVQ